MSLYGETKMPLFIMFVIIVALFLLLPLDIPRSVRVSSPPFPFIVRIPLFIEPAWLVALWFRP